MRGDEFETDVLIVGGGPVGMTLALDLKYRNVDFMLTEATDGSISHPRVGTVGPRSMEFFRRWGIAQEIRETGWPEDHPLDGVWVTAVGGHEIYRIRQGTVGTRPIPDYTPEPEQICPQHWLAPLLLRHVGVHPDGPVRLRWRLDGFTQADDRVTATVTDLQVGSTVTVHARYLVACDGASSSVRKALRVRAPARYPTRVFRNILFHAPLLREQLGERNALFYFLMLSSSLRFPMRSMDGRGMYRLTVGLDGSPEASADALSLVRRAITFDTPVEVLSDLKWHLTHRVAERFRVGRVFLVGDAAHTLSPSGGFGMNTGICSAVDLGWKLAAVLESWGGAGLLDTYEMERQPVAAESLEEANVNLRRTLDRQLPPQIHLDTPEGEKARAEMAERLVRSDAQREFNAPQIHFGFRYTSPIVVPDGSAPPANPRDWRPSAAPGCRAPHAWLRPGVSTLDLFGRGFVLLRFAESERQDGFERAFADRGVPLSTTTCHDPRIAELYERPFVLVRPDGHVAWRGDELPDDPGWLADQVRAE
ncbi:FAD-binding monooxygenase [Carbonactinospora thermoautotrophica]|uniref:FAD-binding monooxygenase n=1 Tax=Carbonactinospora thermoautotrophica TaxID=1469144 RepID=A0A132MSS9_9ACTN|nr:FAD-dependent monooxygenase [Carbonactinospora thermoautotrophica]KWX00854.1 Monooxygenase FAD-binding [Carbonactinospora thermoautotrophica]KWX04308.1 FAD-binding monooxygenase [Carbonactinospora thermoautotrophica]KWX05228.1 FAD-binding monooxygenase [Carbonactinospora thermoautotrophica]